MREEGKSSVKLKAESKRTQKSRTEEADMNCGIYLELRVMLSCLSGLKQGV